MAYLYVKAIHIIFVVSWMAGLFYVVRLFVYHVEANDKPEDEKQILGRQFAMMEHKLWYYITTPAMVLTIMAGAAMLYLNPVLLSQNWMHVKLGFVAALLVYHFICQRIMTQFSQGIFRWGSGQLRLWNEVATILLVAIVFTVILKSAVEWMYGLSGLVIFAVTIMIAVKVVKYYRLKGKQER
ncbi:protoporphyrinogen oxidase HemJ [Flavihumibacter sp. R14]|nr:protoporphyrinogen oxidase HemJ [Flavihumibacter soli]